ncbi:DUF1893 domain-containing protein [Crassaminicella indica]|uniref:DUF1893 domain-containing protein n=1 Tax=Crassaminicella indica TaxID=2855394 RepID=A0ABX8RDH6_9CLOT|nr:DUF1893 domain-containing protein [Crassaminicella indica]QXM07124.1 DUF1893 domain-containing protein [Crassaminicella indica]
MKELDFAKDVLEKEAYTLVIVKEGKVIFSSKDKGIKPMYTAVYSIKEKLEGASVADRIIGRAAAILCKYAKIKALYTKVISDSAVSVLKNSDILFRYEEKSLYIKNRDQTGICPVEQLSQDIDNPIILIDRIKSFLEDRKKENI